MRRLLVEPGDASEAPPPPSGLRSRLVDWLDERGFSRAELKLLGLVWMTTRVWLLAVLLAVVVAKRFTPLSLVSTWDVKHFMAIATEGYATAESRAFFPGMPGLMEAGSLLGLPMPMTGVLVGLIGSALAALALYRMGGVLAAGLWLIAPTTVFTFVGYTEAPFCAAAFWAWHRWRKGHYLSAAILATVACTFRISGIFLIGALVVLTLVGDGRDGEHREPTLAERATSLVWLLLPMAALLAHSWHLKLVTGSWTAWYDAQVAGWNRGVTSPWQAFLNTVKAAEPSSWPGRPEVPVIFALEIVSMAVGLVATVWLLRRRRWASASWIGVQLIAFGTSYWYMSINRAVLLWFPLFVLAAELIRGTGEGAEPVRFDRPSLRLGLLIGWFACSGLVAGGWAWLLYTARWAS